jgi:ligand-binding sensor domain-containing protein
LKQRKGNLWIYGFNVLFSWDNTSKDFFSIKAHRWVIMLALDYESVHQLLEDNDGGVWIATDRGLYFAPGNDHGEECNKSYFSNNKKNSGPNTDILGNAFGRFLVCIMGGWC